MNQSRGRGRGRGRGGRGGSGPIRRDRQSSNRNGDNRGPRSAPRTQSAPRSPAILSTPAPQGRVVGDTIFVSNLAKDITSDDVSEIFNRVGQVKSATVNYNQAGESQGTAEVTFYKKEDAETAVKEYDQAEVEGRVMYVKIVASYVRAPSVVPRRPPPVQTRSRPAPRVVTNGRRQSTGSSSNGRPMRGGGRGGRGGRGRGRGGRSASTKPSAADLDAELDNYNKQRDAAFVAATAGQPLAPSAAGDA